VDQWFKGPACLPRFWRESRALQDERLAESGSKLASNGLARFVVTLPSSQKGKGNPMKKVAVTLPDL